MPMMTISLSPEQERRIRDAIDRGAYRSKTEVVEDALRLWDERESAIETDAARLKRAYDEGVASGHPRRVNAADLLTDFKARARRGG